MIGIKRFIKRTVRSNFPSVYRACAAIKDDLCSYEMGSYSQMGEDMVIKYLLMHQSGQVISQLKPNGLYVDVGACHPRRFSNTYYFYQLGWNGINIDPNPGCMAAFRRLRPRDINLEVGVGKEMTSKSYYFFEDPVYNTLSQELALGYQAKGNVLLGKTQVRVDTLAAILLEYLPKGTPIDFLSIDVEGFDLAVLQSNDWLAYRPKIVVVEELSLLGGYANLSKNPICQFMLDQSYELVTWLGHNLFFQAK
jgi:FkbM family methyltransferase